MTRPTRLGRVPLLSGPLGTTPTIEPDPDPSDPIDYASQAQGASVQVAVLEMVSGELVEGETVQVGSSNGFNPANPSNANDRDYTTKSMRSSGAESGTVSWWWFIDYGSGVEVTSVAVDDPLGGGDQWLNPTGAVVEFSDDGSAWTDSPYTYGTETVPTDLTFPSPTTVTRHVYTLDTASTHQYWRIRQSVGSGFHLASGMSELLMFGAAAENKVWYPAPAANDGDITTSAFSNVHA